MKDLFDTDPFVAPARVSVNGGTWSWDSTNQRIQQTDGSAANHWAMMTEWARASVMDTEYDITMVSDPSGRKHIGPFLHVGEGGSVDGYRLAHLDTGWGIYPYGSVTGGSATVVNNVDVPVGVQQHWKVHHDSTTGQGSLYIDGTLVMNWTVPSTAAVRPAWFTYGNTVAIDNVYFNQPTAPPANPPTVAYTPGNNVVRYSFSALADAESYEYQVDSATPVSVGTSLYGTISGLTNGVSNVIKFRAVNALGSGPWSTATTVTPVPPDLYDNDVLADTPAVYLSTQETAGATLFDVSGNERHGGFSGGVVLADTTDPTLGRYAMNKHVRLNGTDGFIGLPGGSWFAPTGGSGFALEQWVYVRAASSYMRFWDFANAASTSDILVYMAGTTLRPHVQWGGNDQAVASDLSVAGWHHIVSQQDNAGNREWWVDGVRQNLWTGLPLPAAGTRANNYIGKSSYGDPYAPISVARPAVYNHTLTPARIISHFNKGMETFTAPTTTPTFTSVIPSTDGVYAKWVQNVGITKWDYRVDGGAITEVTGSPTLTLTGMAVDTTHTLEVRDKNTAGVGAWNSVSFTTMQTYLYDDFDRADSATTIGSPQLGGPWTVANGTWGITNNALYQPSNIDAQISAPGASDIEIEFQITGWLSDQGVLFRRVDANNTWMLNTNGNVLRLYHRAAGTWTEHMNMSVVFVDGDIIKIVAQGRKIMCLRNDVIEFQMDDEFYNAANTGVGVRLTRSDQRVGYIRATRPRTVPQSYTGALRTIDRFGASLPAAKSGFVYKGRDSKTSDTGSVA